MIVVELRGGLGNQMFQYASARSVSVRLKVPLVLDTRFFSRYRRRLIALGTPIRCYELDGLSISAERLRWHQAAILPLTHRTCAAVGYNPEALKPSRRIYMRGFWQSWRYFSGIRPLLLKEFATSLPIDRMNKLLIDDITSSQSVCIHVRRGDMIAHSETNAIFGACSVPYYAEAIDLIRNRVSSPVFYVFSDDIEWARENIPLGEKCVFVSANTGGPSALDMRLMSKCAHFVTANSTFSWWGAWLSQRKNKIVITPKTWFKARRPPRDLLPAEWIKVPNNLD